MAIITQIINDFSGGMTDERREIDTRFARFVGNFDAHTYRNRLVPFRSSESGDSASADNQIQNFIVALRTGNRDGGTYSLYGLGVVISTARAQVFYKDLSTGGTNDLGDASWTTTSNNTSSAGATSFNLFIYYSRTNRIYGARAGTNIWVYDPAGTAAWGDSEVAITYTSIGQGVVHSKDDILYIPYYNNGGFIASNNNGTWTTAALTLPVHYIPTSICEYGNYLAIACRHVSFQHNSRVFLWDRDSSLTTLSESVDWGEGSLQILEEIEGQLIGISYVGGTNTVFNQRMVIRSYSGGVPNVVKQIISGAAYSTGGPNTDLPIDKQKVNQYLYFMMDLTINGTRRIGLWKIGRQSPASPFSLVFDRFINNDTAVATAATLQGFIVLGDFIFISYDDSGILMRKTDNASTFSVTATYETLIITGGDSSKIKKLISVTPIYEAQPTAGSITVSYRLNAETTYTTLMTDTTDNAISDSAVNIESSAAILPEFKEIDFRIGSSGGTVVTGLKIKYEILDKNLS